MAQQIQISAVREAIQTASAERLREVLTSVCLEQPAALATVHNKLLVNDDEVFKVGEKDDDELVSEGQSPHELMDAEEVPPPSSGTKRKRFEVCDRCDKEYDVATNCKTSCVCHDGMPQDSRNGLEIL
jgi:hypothetical protein